MDISAYLEETAIIDFSHPSIQALSQQLSLISSHDVGYAKQCFEFVRDHIRHSGDHQDNITTCIASDVLKYKTGWCYAKSHLLAALLRAKNIPTALCYQRLSCGEYTSDTFCLHGLNAIYLQDFGWYRVDARGNKTGVDAQFTPPKEQLAFQLTEHERDSLCLHAKPLEVVITALSTYHGYQEMISHFPDCADF